MIITSSLESAPIKIEKRLHPNRMPNEMQRKCSIESFSFQRKEAGVERVGTRLRYGDAV